MTWEGEGRVAGVGFLSRSEKGGEQKGGTAFGEEHGEFTRRNKKGDRACGKVS